MASKLKLVKKLDAVTNPSTLALSVAKNGGPVATTAEVASTGPDDQRFSDSQLTPGPAQKALDPSNSYSIVWTGAFVAAGSVTLRVQILDSQGVNHTNKAVTVQGKAGEVFFRVILIP
jgi:hypothetical protein